MISTRAVAFLLVASGSLGCTEPPPARAADDGWGPSLRGASEPPPESDAPPAPRAKARPEAERPRFSRAGELAALLQVGGRDRSEHLDGAYERTVVVDGAAAGYASLAESMVLPPGALVLQRHHPPGEAAVVAFYGMEKLPPGAAPESADFRFFVLDAQLRVAAEDVALCARCHREAPFRGLFGPPRGASAR